MSSAGMIRFASIGVSHRRDGAMPWTAASAHLVGTRAGWARFTGTPHPAPDAEIWRVLNHQVMKTPRCRFLTGSSSRCQHERAEASFHVAPQGRVLRSLQARVGADQIKRLL